MSSSHKANLYNFYLSTIYSLINIDDVKVRKTSEKGEQEEVKLIRTIIQQKNEWICRGYEKQLQHVTILLWYNLNWGIDSSVMFEIKFLEKVLAR